MAIAVDNLASAQGLCQHSLLHNEILHFYSYYMIELTAAEEEQKELDKEKQWQELQKEIESLKSDDPAKLNDLTQQQAAIKGNEKEEASKEEEEEEEGPKEMLPYSSMFCMSPTNP